LIGGTGEGLLSDFGNWKLPDISGDDEAALPSSCSSSSSSGKGRSDFWNSLPAGGDFQWDRLVVEEELASELPMVKSVPSKGTVAIVEDGFAPSELDGDGRWNPDDDRAAPASLLGLLAASSVPPKFGRGRRALSFGLCSLWVTPN